MGISATARDYSTWDFIIDANIGFIAGSAIQAMIEYDQKIKGVPPRPLKSLLYSVELLDKAKRSNLSAMSLLKYIYAEEFASQFLYDAAGAKIEDQFKAKALDKILSAEFDGAIDLIMEKINEIK